VSKFPKVNTQFHEAAAPRSAMAEESTARVRNQHRGNSPTFCNGRRINDSTSAQTLSRQQPNESTTALPVSADIHVQQPQQQSLKG
jgi:hypothetical protein